jgi:hypothetical protein
MTFVRPLHRVLRRTPDDGVGRERSAQESGTSIAPINRASATPAETFATSVAKIQRRHNKQMTGAMLRSGIIGE